MTCFYCRGNMVEDVTLHTMQLENCIVVVKNVPCHICEKCGAIVFSMPVAQRLEEIAKEYENLVAESKVIDYFAA